MPTSGRSEPIARLGPTRPRGLVGKSRLFHLRSETVINNPEEFRVLPSSTPPGP